MRVSVLWKEYQLASVWAGTQEEAAVQAYREAVAQLRLLGVEIIEL